MMLTFRLTVGQANALLMQNIQQSIVTGMLVDPFP
jgi:hypothetical protein